MKPCSRCYRPQPETEFYVDKRYADGRRLTACKGCIRKRNLRNYYNSQSGVPKPVKIDPAEKILRLVKSGCTHEQLCLFTGMGDDRIGELMVDLILDRKLVKAAIVGNQRIYFLREAA